MNSASRYFRLSVVCVFVGALTGLVVAGFEFAAEELLHEVTHLPLAAVIAAPGLGLLVSAAAIHYGTLSQSGSTSDEYVRAYHERNPKIRFRELPAKLVAGAATVGSGGALGLEGPAIYTGANIGLNLSRFLDRWFTRSELKMIMTAGAAAGVAAIFRTPATGVLFAMEVPYQEDVSRRALIPSLLAAASSFMVFSLLLGDDPVVPRAIRSEDPQTAIFGALVTGLLAGLGARYFARLVHLAKRAKEEIPLRNRLAGGVIGLGLLVVISDRLFSAPLTLGPGLEAMRFTITEGPGLWLLAALVVMRVAATLVTVLAGGVGGMFIPLAAHGWIVGSMIGVAFHEPDSRLFPTLGLAAFLGAGYRAPLASVMFVAESTSGGLFVVPALIAAAAAMTVAGNSTVAGHQRVTRQGHVERRLDLPLTSVITTDVMTVPSDATASEFAYAHVLGRRQRVVPVVDDGRYRGLCGIDELTTIDREEWETTHVGRFMNRHAPPAAPNWTLRDAVRAMERIDTEVLAVCDSEGSFIGAVRSDEIIRLDEILEETSAERP